MVTAREQERTNVVDGYVCASDVHVSLFLSAYMCMFTWLCTAAALVMCLVKVSSSAGSRPSHGSSADSAEWLVARHTAHPMTSVNEN